VIVSYTHNFIFVKTKKTAGTSVEIALSLLCGPDDIVAPIGPGVELERAAAGGWARNFNADRDLERRFRAAVQRGRKARIRTISNENRASGGCTGHMPVARVRELVGGKFFRKALKFTVERHPYEKAVSFAYFAYRGDRGDAAAFAEHLDDTVRHRGYPGHPLYSINGVPRMDAYALHDSLEDDLVRILAPLGLRPVHPLPRARSHTRTDRRPAAEVLSDRQKAIVRKRCAPEFEMFGWPE
jgi:hypothetical protein